jgi:hypothetical protein
MSMLPQPPHGCPLYLFGLPPRTGHASAPQQGFPSLACLLGQGVRP